jgi:hypothetical protein
MSDGEDVLAKYARLGRERAQRLGLRPVIGRWQAFERGACIVARSCQRGASESRIGLRTSRAGSLLPN